MGGLAVVLASLLILFGCSLQPIRESKRVSVDEFIHDSLFAPAIEAADAEIFHVTKAMQDFMANEIPQHLKHSPRALYDAIAGKGQFWLEYDSKRTRTASEAFASRRGNCMSLVIMTAALAKSLGLPVHYQKISVDDMWSRDQGTLLLVGHVNIIIGDQRWNDPRGRTTGSAIVVDFLPLDAARGLRGIEISEATIVAMFLNNRAAEELSSGRIDAAYRFARRAIQVDPTFLAGLNTLGVIYRRHGNLPEAEAVLRALVEREPDSKLALANLVTVLHEQGKTHDSALLALRLRNLEPIAPFHFMNLAQAALARHEFDTARDYFERELDRNPGNSEAHFGLTRAYLELGDPKAARKHLAEALSNGSTQEDQERYGNKLARMTKRL